MKLTDYVAVVLAQNGANVVFGYQGSSISHLIDSISQNNQMQFVETRHEQAAAFAANGFALENGSIGVAISCSGPGAINLMTGIADAYYDSLPCLFITGQVSVREMRTDMEMRQLGFQESDIVSIVEPITKYAVTVYEPEKIAYELEKALYLMREGREGPVVLDIPHNVQGSQIDVETLVHFHTNVFIQTEIVEYDMIKHVADCIMHSKRPVLLLGGGCRGLKGDTLLHEFIQKIKIPVVSSYRGKDVFDNNDMFYLGTIGVYGDRCVNWAVKYSDCLVVLGARLDGRQAADGHDAVAESGKVIVVDLDETELRNMSDRFLKIKMDVRTFIRQLYSYLFNFKASNQWLDVVKEWKQRYPDDKEYEIEEGINPNKFLGMLSTLAPEKAFFSLDVGQNQLWGNVSLKVGPDQTMLQSCGLGSMGFALPAAMGGYYAKRRLPICITGDGGFQMNLQELQTISCYRIPIKIFVLDNQSLGLIRIYQDKALGGRHNGSVEGFGTPDYYSLSKAYGLHYEKIDNNNCNEILKKILALDEACLVEVCISPNSTNYPEPTYLSTIDNQSKELSLKERKRIIKEAYQLERE